MDERQAACRYTQFSGIMVYGLRNPTLTSVETSTGVPHSCHDTGRTTVMSSHSRALQTVSELGISRSALTMK